MAKRRSTGTTPEMNMTPLIDVVFQLIIFFMLVNNIISEQTVQMVVPELEEARTRALDEGTRVFVNVAPFDHKPEDRKANTLSFPGEAQFVNVGGERFSVNDLEGISAELREWKANNPDVEVLLRADAALYYESVAPVMAAISAAEIQTINLVAYMPDAE